MINETSIRTSSPGSTGTTGTTGTTTLIDRALDTELEPQRRLHFKLWLTDNPGTTEESFNQNIWQHFRANIIRERENPLVVKPSRKPAKKRTVKKISRRKAG